MPTTNDCASQDLYKSLTFCPGAGRLPGIRKRLFHIRKSFITTWPTKANGKYTGNFELVEGKYWKYMDVVEKKSKPSSESQGEYPCKTVKQQLEFFFPGMEEDINEFEELAINDSLVYAYQMANGKFKICGCEEYDTDTNFSSDGGQQATDSMGVTFTVTCDAPTDMMVYEGSILIGANEDANPSS